MIRIVFILAAVIAVIWALRWVLTTPSAAVSKQIKEKGIYIVVGILLLLAVSGRLNWLIPVIGAFLAVAARSLPHFLRYAPLLHRLWMQMRGPRPASRTSSTNQSTVEARFLRMRLDHQTGEIDGEVIEGRFVGKHLHELSQSQIVELFREYGACDKESASLIQAYLDRVYGEEWNTSDSHEGEKNSGLSGVTAMNKDEAYQILGLEPGASESEIKAAHKRLIQKFHPDRGGSTYLAAKINQARSLLIG